MIKYAVLTSGSCGNSYAFYDGKSCLLVDAGLTLTGLKRRLDQVDIPFDALTDVLVTHMHPDHSKGLGVLYRAKGVGIHASRQCFESDERLFAKLGLKEDMISVFSFGDELFAGDFHAVPFRTSHDSAGSAGYFIENGDSRFFLMTDTGIYSQESLEMAKASSVVFLESNYDDDMLESGRYPFVLKRRISGERGHLSNRQARDFLFQIGAGDKTVFLVHLSDNNNTVDAVLDNYTDGFEIKNFTVCERGRTYGGFYG